MVHTDRDKLDRKLNSLGLVFSVVGLLMLLLGLAGVCIGSSTLSILNANDPDLRAFIPASVGFLRFDCALFLLAGLIVLVGALMLRRLLRTQTL